MNEFMVSVIIPMYNGEKYIERCLESIINQSYKNLEILIINDNSTDNGEAIVKKYSEIHNNITYIKNDITLGPAKSRNLGLDYTKYPYVLFLDCDDWIDLNCIEKAIEKFKSDSEIDVVLWEINTAFSHNKISSRYKYQYNNIINSNTALYLLSHTFENEFFLSPLLGCKLFKRKLLDLHKISFPDTIYEDDMFTFLSFLYSRKIALVTGSSLYYYQHTNSLTHHFTEKNIRDFFKTFNELYKYIDENNKENYYKYLYKSMNAMIDCMLNCVHDSVLQRNYKTMIFTYFYNNIKIEEYYSYSFSLTI